MAQENATYYNKSFLQHPHWRLPYVYSPFFSLWREASLLIPSGSRVLDLGCGPGQVGNLLLDLGCRSYVGVDFSMKRLRWAEKVCGRGKFLRVDLDRSTAVLEEEEYDCVVMWEFLEHLERDLFIVKRVREQGKPFVITVPNFMCKGHVRCFGSCEEVKERYGGQVKQFKKWFICYDGF